MQSLYRHVSEYYSVIFIVSIFAFIGGLIALIWPFYKKTIGQRPPFYSMVLMTGLIISTLLFFKLGEIFNNNWVEYKIGNKSKLIEGSIKRYDKEFIGSQYRNHFHQLIVISYEVDGVRYEIIEKLHSNPEPPIGTSVLLKYSINNPGLAKIVEIKKENGE